LHRITVQLIFIGLKSEESGHNQKVRLENSLPPCQ
jgi:hypothetical protein